MRQGGTELNDSSTFDVWNDARILFHKPIAHCTVHVHLFDGPTRATSRIVF